MKSPKAGAQSKDFNEIRNTHTDMKVSQEEWDRIWHNYENPENCSGRKRVLGCTICDQLIANKIQNTDFEGSDTTFVDNYEDDVVPF